MIRELRIVAWTDAGEEAIHKLIADDERESLYNKNKVKEQYKFTLSDSKPLTYSARATDKLLDILKVNAQRIGHIAHINMDGVMANFMADLKTVAMQRMGKNGAVWKKDYVVRLIDDDEELGTTTTENPQ